MPGMPGEAAAAIDLTSLPAEVAALIERLEQRVTAEKLRSFTMAVRLELEERLAADFPHGPLLAPRSSATRKELWLPRVLVNQVKDLALEADTTTQIMLATILEAPFDRSTLPDDRVDAKAARRSPRPVAA